ncbi:protein kinase [Streptomyces griseoviridis]
MRPGRSFWEEFHTVHPLAASDPVRIGRYRLTGRLGAGGMGTVYLGSTPGGRPVAIKVISDQFQYEPQALERFRREVDTLHTVRSAYSATIIDSGLDAPPFWFATEYVPGRTLYSAVQASGPLPAQLCLALLAALAEGLSDIHDHEILHRDVKPQNVILSPVGPQLIDFGIARGAGQAALTQVGHTAGTPGFTAPEAFRGEETSAAADVFALGATIAFAATGRPPYGDGSFSAIAYRTVHGDIDVDGVEPRLAEILAACTHRDPAERPTPGEIVELRDAHTSLADDPHYRLISAPEAKDGVPATVPVPTAPDASAGHAAGGPVPAELPTAAVPTQVVPGTPSGTAVLAPPPGFGPPGSGDPRPRSRRRTVLIAAAATVAVGVAAATALTLLPGNDTEKDSGARAAASAAAADRSAAADDGAQNAADTSKDGQDAQDAQDGDDAQQGEDRQDGQESGGQSQEPPAELVVSRPVVVEAGGELIAARIRLVMQRDGNLVAYDEENKARWASKTSGDGATAEFQDDGNLVVYDKEHRAVWASKTNGHENAVLTLRGDGNITISDGDAELWSTGTAH